MEETSIDFDKDLIRDKIYFNTHFTLIILLLICDSIWCYLFNNSFKIFIIKLTFDITFLK